MPVKITPIPSSIITFDLNNNDDVERTRPFANDDFWKGIVTEPDQLRRRVAGQFSSTSHPRRQFSRWAR